MIGRRIKFFRNRKGLTQKQLGEKLGFKGKTSEVRMAQYETESRIPKEMLLQQIAYLLDISPLALNVPEIDSLYGLMHTLFALEDIYGFKITEKEGELCLCLDKTVTSTQSDLYSSLVSWQKEFAKLNTGEISKEEYDHWRYTYPEMDAQRTKAMFDQLRTKQKNNTEK